MHTIYFQSMINQGHKIIAQKRAKEDKREQDMSRDIKRKQDKEKETV